MEFFDDAEEDLVREAKESRRIGSVWLKRSHDQKFPLDDMNDLLWMDLEDREKLDGL